MSCFNPNSMTLRILPNEAEVCSAPEARQVQAESGQSGPLVPDDIREAYRRYTATSDKRGSDRAKLFVR